MAYKKCLVEHYEEYHKFYRMLNKMQPSWSIQKKQDGIFDFMLEMRKQAKDKGELSSRQLIQETWALLIFREDMLNNKFEHYYVNDEALFDFLINTKIKDVKWVQHDVLEKLKNEDTFELIPYMAFFIHGKTQAYTICITKHPQSPYPKVYVFTETANVEFFITNDNKKQSLIVNPVLVNNMNVYNLVINFLYYKASFPECIIDGVPKEEGKKAFGKTIKIHPQIVERTITSSDGRIVTPHFRQGCFVHYDSDYYVNKKGTVGFRAGSMVKGRAKTVLTSEKINNTTSSEGGN